MGAVPGFFLSPIDKACAFLGGNLGRCIALWKCRGEKIKKILHKKLAGAAKADKEKKTRWGFCWK